MKRSVLETKLTVRLRLTKSCYVKSNSPGIVSALFTPPACRRLGKVRSTDPFGHENSGRRHGRQASWPRRAVAEFVGGVGAEVDGDWPSAL
jgi:hypothetical protein